MLTNIVLGKMPSKPKAQQKNKGKVQDQEVGTAPGTLWGFDREGNLRTHGPLEDENTYANLGALKKFSRGRSFNTETGVAYTLTTAMDTELKLASKNFRTHLWAEKCDDGDNMDKDSLASVEGFESLREPNHIVAALDGRTQRGVEGFGEGNEY